jgi:hypothetical protein
MKSMVVLGSASFQDTDRSESHVTCRVQLS